MSVRCAPLRDRHRCCRELRPDRPRRECLAPRRGRFAAF